MKVMKHIALLSLSALLSACGGGGGSVPTPPNPGGSNPPPALNMIKIGEGDSLGEFLRTAANARGDVIAVWRKFSDDPLSFAHSEIWANVYHPVTGWGAAQKVQAQAPAAFNTVDVAMDNNGDAVIAWMDDGSAGGNIIDMKVAVYVAGVWQPPQVLDQDLACIPQLSADPSGATVARMTWCASGEVRSSGYRVAGGWSVPVAVPLALPVALPGETAPTTYWRIGAGIDMSGALQVVANTRYDLRAVRGVAGVWEPVSVIRSFNSTTPLNPYLAVGVNGHAVMAWLEPAIAGYQLWVAYHDGAVWSPPVILEEDTGLVMGNPPSSPWIQIALDNTGAAVLVWERIGQDVRAGRYRAGVWETTVLTTTGTAPHLATNANGDVRVAWDAGSGEVWSRHFSGAQSWGAPVQLTDRTRLDTQIINIPLVELAPDGKPLLIWADETGVWSMITP